MSTFFTIILSISFLLGVLGCSGVKATAPAGSNSPNPPVATSTQVNPSPVQLTPVPSASTESSEFYRLTNSCELLNSHDLASLFSSAEVVLPTPQVSQVNQVIFSKENSQAEEIICTYYVFHNPGSKDMVLLQVTYWVVLPDQTKPSVLAQVWTDAKSQTTQAIPGIGDGAFYENGRLTFKKGDIYVTIEVTGTQINPSTRSGESQQLELEKQVALDALNRLP